MLASAGEDGKAGARPRIARLRPDVAARIAAGEVIERPASIVKELLENALDAGATVIELEITGGGIDLIRVRDNGHGIPPDQLADAFERHATSKLRDDRDLAAVRTLGFRGEALAAIVAAGAVDCTTRTPAEEAAATTRWRSGSQAGQGSAAAAPGTTFAVRDLFAEQPARRRFLASPRAEARACLAVCTDVALAHPAVALHVRSEGRLTLRTPGDGDRRSAAAAIYGAEVARALLPAAAESLAGDDDDAAEHGPGQGAAAVAVHGLVGPPSLHRANRRAIHLFVNGRPVENRALRAAVELGYAGLLPGGRHPLAMLEVHVPPELVDVNVHPRKAEVRFRHERQVFATVRRAVLSALDQAAVAREGAAPADGWLQPTGAFRYADAAHSAGVPGAERGRDRLAEARPALRWRPPAERLPLLEAERGAPPDPGEAPVPHAAPPAVAAADHAADGEVQPALPALPALRPLGQIDRTFIAAEGPDGLYLVDQHAAHERVWYERLQAARAAGTPVLQPLLATAVVTLTPDRAALLHAETPLLRALGWEVEPADGSAVLLRAVPVASGGGRDPAGDPGRALTELLDAIEAEERLSGPDRVIATQACRLAVMAGDALAPEAQRRLLDELAAASQPHTCPHGRPTTIRIDRAALRRAFGRPGGRA